MPSAHSNAGLIAQAQKVIESYSAAGQMVATAESCTGGMIACLLTEIAGSSAVVDRGFVTYSNESKMEMLGVSEQDLISHGAVSEEVAAAMALGALQCSNASAAVSVTGIAGPGGGTAVKPVGTVCFGFALSNSPTRTEKIVFPDTGRSGIRCATAAHALQLLLSR